MAPPRISPVHWRIHVAKIAPLQEKDAHIQKSSTSLDDNALQKLNALLLRKEDTRGVRNWPRELSTFSRLIL